MFSTAFIRLSGTKYRSNPSVLSSRPSLMFKLTSKTLFFGPFDGSRALGKVSMATAVIVMDPGVAERAMVVLVRSETNEEG